MEKFVPNRYYYRIAEAREISPDVEKDLGLNLIDTSMAHENGRCCANISLSADAVYTSRFDDKILSLCESVGIITCQSGSLCPDLHQITVYRKNFNIFLKTV